MLSPCQAECLEKIKQQVNVTGDLFQAAVRDYISDRASSPYGSNITCWDVSRVDNMANAFYNLNSQSGWGTFNEPLDCWDVSNVTTMKGMFSLAFDFNQPIGSWDVSKVTNMEVMFYQASTFNQPLGSSDVSRVTNMANMFNVAEKFNQTLCSWNGQNVSPLTTGGMFDRSGCTNINDPSSSNWCQNCQALS
jgi:surface protein